MSKASNPPAKVYPVVNGEPLEMELDSGSALSVLPVNKYKQLKQFSKIPIEESGTVLKTYTGERFIPKGVLTVDVSLNGQSETLKLYVVDDGDVPLFGRDYLKTFFGERWAEKFTKLQKVNHDSEDIHQVKSSIATETQARLESLLTRYSQIFEEGIGKVTEQKATLVLKDNAKPVFCKARPVPYSIQPKIEEELD